MLKSMREGAKSTPMQIFLVILAVGFALWGIGDVFRTVASNDSAIKVGTVEVSAMEAAREFDRTRRTYLPTSNNSEAIASGLLSNILAELARRTLFVAEGQRMGLTVTRDMEKQAIADEPAFKDDLGQFSVLRFRDTLARVGMNEDDYLAFIGQLLMQNQITDAMNAGATYPKATAEAIARWRLEQRVISIAEIPVDTATVPTPDDAAMRTWYGENSSLFDSPDLRFGVAAVISPDVFAETVSISEAEIADFYDNNAAAWQQEETRTVNQMIFADPNAANTAVSRIRSGEEFTAVAAETLGLESDDINLGSLRRDDLSPALAEDVFAAEADQVIGPIETPLGQHVLIVTEITAPEKTPLDDVRARITEDLKREKATDLVYDKVAVLEDAIAGGATIEEAARQSGAALIRLDGMDRNGRDIDGNPIEGIAEDTTFRQSFWTVGLNEEGLVEDAGEDTFFITRADSEEAARGRDLEEVRDRVISVMMNEMAITAARTTGEGIIDAADAETAAAAAGTGFGGEASLRRDGVGLDHEAARLIAAKAFELDVGAKGIVETGTKAIVVAVKAITPAADDQIDAEAVLFQEELTSGARDSMTTSLLLGLEKQFDVEISAAPVQQLLIGASN